LLQDAVSIVYDYGGGGGLTRLLENGGGPEAIDLINYRSGATNCDQHCTWLEGAGYFSGCCPTTSKTYYSRCWEETAAQPLNGRRYSFPSQIGTTGIDPALPQNFANFGGNSTLPCRGTLAK